MEKTNEVCKNTDNLEPKAYLSLIIINKDECRRDIGHYIYGEKYVAEPYPTNFESDICHGCSFWWLCQMVNNNRQEIRVKQLIFDDMSESEQDSNGKVK